MPSVRLRAIAYYSWGVGALPSKDTPPLIMPICRQNVHATTCVPAFSGETPPPPSPLPPPLPPANAMYVLLIVLVMYVA